LIPVARTLSVGIVCAAVSASLEPTSPASAQTPAEFFKGKTLTVLIGTSPGNDYDFRARLIARHIGRHIPGEPQLVPRNMPGGGGIVATNYIANIAPRDGTTLYMIMSNMMTSQAMGLQGVQFDTRKFRWIGNTTSSPNVVNSWHTTGITKIEQTKTRDLVLGAPVGTAGVLYATALQKVYGAKIKLVTGYPGGGEVNIAMERGEVEGRGSNSWSSWKSTKPDWLTEKKLNILVQVGLTRDKALADVPLLLELASNDLDRQVLGFISAETAIARAIVAPPDVPADRVEALRRAFDAAMKDPELLADAAKSKIDVEPMRGEDAQKIADGIANASPAVIARARDLFGDLVK
jgi:tripartite-type tricarboxylate transporter receptor subunit TctC